MKRIIRALGFRLLAVVCAAAPALGEPRNTLTIGLADEPATLDPTRDGADVVAQIMLGNVLEGLVRLEPDFAIASGLARSWSFSPDRKTLKLFLRMEAKFQDGEAFSASDVKFSFERAAALGSNNPDHGFFDSIAWVDDSLADVAVLHFRRPRADALYHLALASAVIVDARGPASAADQPIGTGPYRLESWSRHASLSLEKWLGYRDSGGIAIERATFRFLAEPSTQVSALEVDDVDVFPRFAQYGALKQFANSRFQIMRGRSLRKFILAIDNRRAPFTDLRVRQALAAGIDRKALVTALTQGMGRPIGSHAASLEPGYADLSDENAYDPARARALLEAAGLKQPLRVAIAAAPLRQARAAAELIAAQLKASGVEAGVADSDEGVSGLSLIVDAAPLGIARYGRSGAPYFYNNPAYAGMLGQFEGARDLNAFTRAMGAAQIALSEDCVNVYLYEDPQVTIADARLLGLPADAPTAAFPLAKLSWR